MASTASFGPSVPRVDSPPEFATQVMILLEASFIDPVDLADFRDYVLLCLLQLMRNTFADPQRYHCPLYVVRADGTFVVSQRPSSPQLVPTLTKPAPRRFPHLIRLEESV